MPFLYVILENKMKKKLKEIVNSSVNKYSPFKVISLDDRTWPSKQIKKSPIWCSVDLKRWKSIFEGLSQ